MPARRARTPTAVNVFAPNSNSELFPFATGAPLVLGVTGKTGDAFAFTSAYADVA